MLTNKEFLDELASRGDGSLQAWFDAERVDANDANIDSRDRIAELEADNALLLDANARLQCSLAEASEEREVYREKFGKALDYAAAILRWAD